VRYTVNLHVQDKSNYKHRSLDRKRLRNTGKMIERVDTRRAGDALVQPGGRPSVMEGCVNVEVEVVTIPDGSVRINVTRVGAGDMVGKPVTLNVMSPNTGLYVLVASSEETISPIDAYTEVLKAYGGVVYVGVATGKFGRVVAMVWEAIDKNDETAAGDSAVVLLALN
jgi:hypothetical protein